MDIAIDVQFEPSDAFRATMFAASQPLVLEPEPAPAPASAPPPPRSLAPTPPVLVEPERRAVWWPLALIGFVAVVCATIAFLKSPLASHPSVAPYASAVLAKIG